MDKRANEENTSIEEDAAETRIWEHLGIEDRDNPAIHTEMAPDHFGFRGLQQGTDDVRDVVERFLVQRYGP